MTATYEVKIYDPFGQQLASVTDFADPRNLEDGGAALDYGFIVGQVGLLNLTLPVGFDESKLLLDGRIEVWRKVGNLPAKRDGDAQYLIRLWNYGPYQTSIQAVHVNELYQRRIVDYYAGTAFSSKTTTTGDDLIKEFVSENAGAGISAADRIGAETQADISALLSIQADLGAGVSMNKSAAWRNLFDVMRELSDASTQGGTYLTFDTVATGPASLELQTFTTQRGVDRRASSGQPLIFSKGRGNIENINLRVDRRSEITFVTGGGNNEDTSRVTATAVDAVRMADSPFNRREVFYGNPNISDPTTLAYECDRILREGRPKISLTADAVETATCTRGVHYDYGDYVTVEHRGKQYDTRIEVVGVSLNNRQQESRIQFRVNA